MRHDPTPRRIRPTRRSTALLLLLLRLIPRGRRSLSLRQLSLLLTRSLWWLWATILWRRWQHPSIHEMRRRSGISKLRHGRLTWLLLLLLSGLLRRALSNTWIMLWRMRMPHRRTLEWRPSIRVGSASLWRHPVHHGTLLPRHHRKLHLLLLRTSRTWNPIRLRWWWATGVHTHPRKIHRSTTGWHPLLELLLLRRLLTTHTRIHADAVRHRPINHVRVWWRSMLHIWGQTVSQTAASHILLLLLSRLLWW